MTSRKGSVQVQAAGESVRVNSGQQTLIRRQKAPTQPGEIPTSLFVKINQHKKVHGKKRFVLRGRTSPGAMVTIQGKQVLADARGHYSSIVALREGANRIRIRTVDGLGRRKSIETNIERDSTGPDVSGDVKWGHP